MNVLDYVWHAAAVDLDVQYGSTLHVLFSAEAPATAAGDIACFLNTTFLQTRSAELMPINLPCVCM